MAQKPGYMTTEFYAMCGAQVSAFVVALSGTDATAKVMTGLVALAAVVGYLLTRYWLKSDPVTPLLALVVLLLLAGDASAQFRLSIGSERHHGGFRLSVGGPAVYVPAPPVYSWPAPAGYVYVNPLFPAYPGEPTLYFVDPAGRVLYIQRAPNPNVR